jgi:hypothetical protein
MKCTDADAEALICNCLSSSATPFATVSEATAACCFKLLQQLVLRTSQNSLVSLFQGLCSSPLVPPTRTLSCGCSTAETRATRRRRSPSPVIVSTSWPWRSMVSPKETRKYDLTFLERSATCYSLFLSYAVSFGTTCPSAVNRLQILLSRFGPLDLSLEASKTASA